MDPITAVRILIGDTATSPFYMLFSDEEIQFFLDQNNQNIQAAARMAAISASFQLAGWSSRERVGDVEIWSNLSTQYLKALEYLINQPVSTLPNGLMPYAAGISWSQVNENNLNPDNVRPALTQISLCDKEDLCSLSSTF